MKVDLVVCTRNNAASLEQTFNFFEGLEVANKLHVRVIIVDNGSGHASKQQLRPTAAKFELTFVSEPTPGLSRARNTAIEHLKSDYAIFTDDDVSVPPDWLSRYASAFERYPDAAFFGADIEPVFPGAPPGWAAALLTAAASCFASFKVGRVDVRVDAKSAQHLYPFGANMAFRTDILKNHRFDEALGRQPSGLVLSGEETSIVADMIAAGHHGYLIADNPVQHRIAAPRQTLDYVHRYYHGQGWQQAMACCEKGGFGVWVDKVLSVSVLGVFKIAKRLADLSRHAKLRVWCARQAAHFQGRVDAFSAPKRG